MDIFTQLTCWTHQFFHICLLSCTISIVNGKRQDLSKYHRTEILNYHVRSNVSWMGPLISSKTPGNHYAVRIEATYAPENCCPRFVLSSKAMDPILIRDGCYNVSAEELSVLHTAEFSDPNYFHVEDPDPYYDRCTLSNSSGMYTCIWVKFDAMFTPANLSLYTYHPCFERQTMDFTVNIYLWTKIIPHKCKALDTDSPCHTFYPMAYPSTLFGGNQDFDIPNVAGASLVNKYFGNRCHQHLLPSLCRVLFPECTTKGPIFPCRSMCFEVMHACSEMAQSFFYAYFPNKVGIDFATEYICRELPDEGRCYSENVTCKFPGQIQHGTLLYNRKLFLPNETSVVPVHSTATYECNKDYKLDWNRTVVCQYSGQWSKLPQCIPISNKKLIIMLGTTFGVLAGITVIAILIGLIFRREFVVILYAKFGMRFSRDKEEDRKFDTFIAYNQEDIGFVKHQLLRALEKMKPQFKICIHHRDFEIGNFITTNIINAIKQSRRTIILLSQSFIDSEWCKFEFEQAHLQLLHDKSYRILVIALDDPKHLQNIPQLIQSYILTRTYLMGTDKLFWQKLLYQMPEKKATNERDDETMQEMKEQQQHTGDSNA